MDEILGNIMRILFFFYGFVTALFLLITGVTGGTATFTGTQAFSLGIFVATGTFFWVAWPTKSKN